MRFSTRTRYGLRFLLRLAAHPTGEFLRLPQVAQAENISPGYLEQIVRMLRPAGILRTARGSGGGYALARSPAEISVKEIFQHLEGEITPVTCLTKDFHCSRESVCPARNFWNALDENIHTFLQRHTLQDIIEMKNHPSGGSHVELH